MGIVLSRAEVVKGLEPVTAFNVEDVRGIFRRFEAACPTPALWERAFSELLGCFPSSEACTKAFHVLDTDGNGLVDGREVLGALAVVSKGRLTDRMALLFDIFDLNGEREMAFDEVFLMLRRTMSGLRKMVGISAPPEKIIHSMTKQIYKTARKHKDHRVLLDDWYNWWATDASCRNALKMFCWNPEDQRGLPTPDQFAFVDYAKGVQDPDDPLTALRGGAAPGTVDRSARPPSGPKTSSEIFARADGDGRITIGERALSQVGSLASGGPSPRPPAHRSSSPRPTQRTTSTAGSRA